MPILLPDFQVLLLNLVPLSFTQLSPLGFKSGFLDKRKVDNLLVGRVGGGEGSSEKGQVAM